MNTNLDQMAARCPGAVCLGPAWIMDYALVFRYCADIEPAVGNWCDGVLWEITMPWKGILIITHGSQ
jgi:hypothetical protein